MKRQLIALGLASILTVPTWVSVANSMDASAKEEKVSKKAKAVITKIKAVNAKKSTYIKTTQAAQKAYNKLSKADKKKVSNYKTLQKHSKAIKPLIAKANKVKKDAAALSSKNYKKNAAKVNSSYKALNTAGKAYVPAATVSKINSYVRLSSANTSMARLSISASSTTPVATKNSATEILTFITAYEKLTANQKLILKDHKDKINYYLGFKPIVSKAIDFDTKYGKLNPKKSGYLKPAYDLYTTYSDGQNTAVDLTYRDTSVSPAIETVRRISIADMTKNHANILKIKDVISKEYALKETFEAAVGSLPGTTKQYDLVLTAEKAYKAVNATTSNGTKLLGKPLDIVDKEAVTEYKKYMTIPSVIKALNNAVPVDSKNAYADTAKANLKLAGFTDAEILTIKDAGLLTKAKDVTAIDTAIKNYAKLGSDQKEIVDVEVGNQKEYMEDASVIKRGQSIAKAYADALAKNDLATMLKQFDAYKALVKAEDRAIRYAVNANEISVAPVKYKAQMDRVATFEQNMETYKTVADIEKLKAAHTVIKKDKPSGVKLIDPAVAKDYSSALTVLDIKATMAKATPANSTMKLNYILSAVKLYNKLDQPKKDIVDGLKLGLEDYAFDEKDIKAAMAIDKKYLALKKASKSYVKDVNSVYNDYLNAPANVQKYIINLSEIAGLTSALVQPKAKVSAFETAVNTVYNEVYTKNTTDVVTIKKMKALKDTYENEIRPYAKYNDLLEADVLKKYKSLAPIVAVYNQIFYLKPTPKTEVERENILKAIKAYDKLDNFGKAVIEIEDNLRVNLNLLDDEPAIAQAKKIDATYNAIRVNDTKYEQKINNVYKSYQQALADVKNYVLNKTVLNEASAKYADTINAAEAVEKAIGEVNVNSAIIHIHELKDIYTGNKKKYPKLDLFIDPEKLKVYKKYLNLLTLQDVAQIVYSQQLISGDWVKYDAWFYTYGQTQDHKNDVLNMRKVLLLFRDFTPIQLAILNNSPNYDSYTGMKEDKNGNNIPIYDGSGNAILGYEKELNFNDKFAPKEVIYNPVDWLNATQIQHVLEAIELENRYKKLKAGSKSYVREAMDLVEDYNESALPVQVYFQYSAALSQLEKQYKEPLKAAEAFETAVKAFNPNTDKLTNLAPLKTAYNKLNQTALSIVDPTLLKKYNAYIDAEDVHFDLGKVKFALKPATMINNANSLNFITKYNKLTADGKKIVLNENSSKEANIATLLADDKNIKAAQTIDKKYEAMDLSAPALETNLLKLYKDYAKLAKTAKELYSVYGKDLEAINSKYGPGQSFGSFSDNPSATADEFTRVVNLLDSSSPYQFVKYASDLYNFLSTPQKYNSDSSKTVVAISFVLAPTVAKYKKYEGLVTIAKSLDDSIVRPYAAVKSYTVKEKDNILLAIAAHKKLSRDARNIFENDPQFGAVLSANPEEQKRYLVLIEEDIKIAAAADTNFQKIKKGDASFVKNMIIAMKSYYVLSPLQKKFFTEQDLYNTYQKDYKIADKYAGKVNTIPEAIKAITEFELAVRNAQVLHDDIIQTGPIPSTTTTQQVIDAIVQADEFYDFLNRDFTIDGQKMRLTALVDNAAILEYKYFMSIYKVEAYLKALNN